MKHCLPKALAGLFLLVAALVGWKLMQTLSDPDGGGGRSEARAFPVETSPVVQNGVIEERRTFSGSLEPSASIQVASKVSGRVRAVEVDLADPVKRNQVVVELDDDEFRQALARAQADLAVAEARFTESTNRLDISRRELERVRQLADRGVSSAAALDSARAEFLVRDSAVQVAEAGLKAEQAAVESARLQLEDTRVRAAWSQGDDERVVAERWTEEGDMVSAGQPLLSVVELQPVQATITVPERDYARLAAGQAVELRTDAWPDQVFHGAIHRVAPVFQEASRQARVEIRSENPDRLLKPGMFVRATVTLDHLEGVTTVPEVALTRRGDVTGIFMVDPEYATAKWVEVTPGIREGGRVRILEDLPAGEVVTLGQQLLDDGSSLILPGAEPDTP